MNISHEGKYYHNTKKSPVPAKEYVHVDEASLLSISEDGGMFDEDKDIFSIEIVVNEGVRGRLKFIGRQHETSGPKATNLARLMPSIRHFVKSISISFIL